MEFSGVPGVLSISIGLPALCLAFHQLINDDYLQTGLTIEWSKFTTLTKTPREIAFNGQVWTYYLLWFFGLAFFDLIIPGTIKQGVELRDGTKLSYNINGIQLSALFVVTLTARWQLTSGSMPEFVFLYDHILEFTTVTIIFSALLALFVYMFSFVPLTGTNGKGTKERVLALGGNTGNFIYDWFIGRELNPRIGPWDIKLFCELRPGMLLWLLLNLSSMHHQWITYGRIYDSMILINSLQAFYIFDGVLNEEGVLTMMDVTTDGFGFMLSFGDLCLVPFSYSLQSRFLSRFPLELGLEFCGLVILISIIGFYIFKASNDQKNAFRQGKLSHLKSIQTQKQTKLLCDGWWKLSQHPNYFGDWLHSVSWCLPTGFVTPLTYYYIFYFAGLLFHRQHRDELKCRDKYGDAWLEYEKEVPYKIIPWVY
jgi:delta14-sterol reductase